MEIPQQSLCVDNQGSVGIASLSTNMSQILRGSRTQCGSHSSVEKILYTQPMAAPMTSSPGFSLFPHPGHDTQDTLCTHLGQDIGHALHSVTAVEEQPMVQFDQLVPQQRQASKSCKYSTAAERMQWHHEQAA